MIKAAVKVNTERLYFNWQLGRDLVERKAEEKWGKGIVMLMRLKSNITVLCCNAVMEVII